MVTLRERSSLVLISDVIVAFSSLKHTGVGSLPLVCVVNESALIRTQLIRPVEVVVPLIKTLQAIRNFLCKFEFVVQVVQPVLQNGYG